MVVIHHSSTVPVNPEGVTPVLTQDQVYAALKIKIRNPQLFVPVIEKSRTLKDDNGVIERTATFKKEYSIASGHANEIHEVCTEHPPNRVDYSLDNGSVVFNVVSTGPSDKPEDLYLTYVFAWKHDELEEGSDATKEATERHIEVGQKATASSLVTIRRLATEGKI